MESNEFNYEDIQNSENFAIKNYRDASFKGEV